MASSIASARRGRIYPWTEQTLDPELVAIVKTYKERNNPVLSELFRRYADREILIFRTRDEADQWLTEQ